MKSSSCYSSYYTQQVKVVSSLFWANTDELNKRTQSNPQILNFIINNKIQCWRNCCYDYKNSSQMKLTGLKPVKVPKYSLITTPRSKRKRGISLSNQKQKKHDENKENMPYVASQKKALQDKKSKISNFIIFNMDRDQWESSKKQYLRSNITKVRHHVIQPTTLKIDDQIRTVKQFTNSIEFPSNKQSASQNPALVELNELTKPKNKGRAREIRSRISQIEQRLNCLLQSTKIN